MEHAEKRHSVIILSQRFATLCLQTNIMYTARYTCLNVTVTPAATITLGMNVARLKR